LREHVRDAQVPQRGPRPPFFLLRQFALAESERVWDESDLGGMPARDGIADRFRSFVATTGAGRGAELLRRGLEYAARAPRLARRF
jgi:aspartate 4-decarboxylase